MTAFVILLVTGLIIIAATWSDVRQVRTDLRRRRLLGSPGPSHPAAGYTLVSYEGLLVRQLLGGTITSAQYRRAMSATAARDADRNPVEIPLPPPGTSEPGTA